MSKHPKEEEALRLIEELPERRKALAFGLAMQRCGELQERSRIIDDRYQSYRRDYPGIARELSDLLRQEVKILQSEYDFIQDGDPETSQRLFDWESGVHDGLMWLLRGHDPSVIAQESFRVLDDTLRQESDLHRDDRTRILEHLAVHDATAQKAANLFYACDWQGCIDYLNEASGKINTASAGS